MAIAKDVVSTSLNLTATAWTISHAAAATVKGVLVGIVQGDTSDDAISGITYGGDALAEVGSSPYITTGNEPATIYWYFKGSAVAGGTQDCVITPTAGRRRQTVVITFTATNDTEFNVASTPIESNALDDPSGTIALGGITSYVVQGFMSGLSAVGNVTELSGWSVLAEGDFGSQLGVFYDYDTIASSDVTTGYTSTSADNVYLVAVAINEAAGGQTITGDSGSYTYTGTAAGLVLSALISGDTAAYNYTGSNADLVLGTSLQAETDQYSYSGTNTDLVLSASVSADTDQYTYTGTDAGILAGVVLSSDTEQYSYTGTAADLIFGSVGNFTLTADTDLYTYSGTDSGLLYGANLIADTEQYNYAGTAATLTRNFNLSADTSQYTYAGTEAALQSDLIVISDSGSYIITGTVVALAASSDSIWVDTAIATTSWAAESKQVTAWSDEAETSTVWTVV